MPTQRHPYSRPALHAQSRAKDIANHAADAGGTAAIRFDGAGMIVRLNLEADGVRFIKRDDAGIVGKNRQTEVGRELRIPFVPSCLRAFVPPAPINSIVLAKIVSLIRFL